MSHAVTNTPPVDIVINNFNYAAKLAEAIDSALGQSYPNTRVIVVDDGSTDGSPEIIAGYEDKVLPIFKENGGQGSAYNAGFSKCQGDLVLFLDSDDVLFDDTVERVVEVHLSRPEAAKISYRLEMVDDSLRPLGVSSPREGRKISTEPVLDLAGARATPVSPPASGNAFPSRILTRIMPIVEEAAFRNAADRYLIELAPLFGPTAVLDGSGGYYRVHGENQGLRHAGRINMSRVRGSLERTAALAAVKEDLLPSELDASPLAFWGLSHISMRGLSVKLEPERHPFSESLYALCLSGMRLAVTRPAVPLHRRLAYLGWFGSLILLPRRACLFLASQRMRAVSPLLGVPIVGQD